jgi:hypothetical protein
MKLKLEELAPYLPYKLQCMAQGEGKKQFELQGISDISYADLHEKGRTVCEQYDIEDVFPILKPLSDLNTKYGENEVNEHFINTLIEEKYKLDYGVFSHYKGFLHIELDGDLDLRYDSNKCIDFDVIFEIQKQLFKHHFDVFGLIEKGLAIDINTL